MLSNLLQPVPMLGTSYHNSNENSAISLHPFSPSMFTKDWNVILNGASNSLVTPNIIVIC